MAKSRSNKDKNRILFFLVIGSIIGLFFLANAGYIKIPGFQAIIGETYSVMMTQYGPNTFTTNGPFKTNINGNTIISNSETDIVNITDNTQTTCLTFSQPDYFIATYKIPQYCKAYSAPTNFRRGPNGSLAGTSPMIPLSCGILDEIKMKYVFNSTALIQCYNGSNYVHLSVLGGAPYDTICLSGITWNCFYENYTYDGELNDTACYQEQANIATPCGGLSSGTYNYSGTGYHPSYLYDGKYHTHSYPSVTNTSLVYYISYAKPTKALSESKWGIFKNTAPQSTLSEIPLSCWNADENKISFKLSLHTASSINSVDSYINASCYDGSEYILMDQIATKTSIVYEEFMVWVNEEEQIMPTGCQFDNPSCDTGYSCVSNSCILNSGCAYFNPRCSSDENCEDNVCVQKAVSAQQTTASETQLPEEELGAQITEEERAATETSLFQTKYLFIGIVAIITIILLISLNIIKPKKIFKK